MVHLIMHSWSRWLIKTSKIWGYQWYCSFTLLKFDNCLILFCCEKVTLLLPFNSIKASNKIQDWTSPMCCLFMLSWFSYSTLRVWFVCFVFVFVFLFFLFFVFFFVFVFFFSGSCWMFTILAVYFKPDDLYGNKFSSV